MDRNVDSRHEVLFYASDAMLIEGLSRFAARALRAHNPVIIFATKPHRDAVVQELTADGFDVDDAIKRGTYISLDATDVLSAIMVDGAPDRLRFFDGLCTLIEATLKTARLDRIRVSICGECLGLLCAEGNIEAAIRLEEVANDFAKAHNVEMMCAYPLSSFANEHTDVYERICAEHTATYSF